MAQYQGYKGQATQTYRKLHGYKNLVAWQAADDLTAYVHDIAVRFERRYYRLTNQMLGSKSSVKANIAEGYCRNALRDYIRFCGIARGSLGELGSQIQDCER
jgi:four helix bundle protein